MDRFARGALRPPLRTSRERTGPPEKRDPRSERLPKLSNFGSFCMASLSSNLTLSRCCSPSGRAPANHRLPSLNSFHASVLANQDDESAASACDAAATQTQSTGMQSRSKCVPRRATGDACTGLCLRYSLLNVRICSSDFRAARALREGNTDRTKCTLGRFEHVW
jgi:hypothetical protein